MELAKLNSAQGAGKPINFCYQHIMQPARPCQPETGST